ncbi:Pentapeptide repeat-containing protein [Granulicella pectinivorans]|uniref:Pentapeptide repeat-containing protein n=1 Tax=Granulicella pectinivorans TaxID=474950 RepID=A0A1I6N198_9BACT|nr:pentapeptide repeat-containing protein [Granulicella pectinivorans]SFS21742.1 Pentapeptide repeat-containing protein [Granulicella pectinivorans]
MTQSDGVGHTRSIHAPHRLTYEESCRFLQSKHLFREGDIPPLLDRPPRYDDEVLGVDLFRWNIQDSKLENLTLPRTYIGRSEFSQCSFAGTDLNESVANWNDFLDVSFVGTNLTSFDMRACNHQRSDFTRAILRNADLRLCNFEDCRFDDADMAGAKLTREAAATLLFSEAQRNVIDWQADDGPEPDGG